jgi:hypothetical protein
LNRSGAISVYLDVPVAEVVLQSSCVVAIIGELKPQAWRSMCGWIGKGILAASPTRWMRPAALGNEHVGVFGVIAS